MSCSAHMHPYVHRLHQLLHLPRGFIYREEIIVKLKNYEQDDQIRVRGSILKNTKVHCYISINLHHLSQGALRAYGRVPIQQIIKQTILSFLRWKCGGPHRETRTSLCTHGQFQPRDSQGQSSSAATEWRLSTKDPALTPIIPNFPETYDCLWELLLPITQLS